MLIDWVEFSPFPAFVGGLLIGTSAACLVLFTGRIAGVSGILGGLFRWKAGETGWRLAFLAGLIAAPAAYRVLAPLPIVRIEAGWGMLLMSGVLVGLGTRYGAGCTSGHGVCGLSRMSWRSLIAVITFLLAGFFTVFLVRHLLGSGTP